MAFWTIGHVTNNGLIAPGQAIAGVGIFGGGTPSSCKGAPCSQYATGIMAYLDGGTNITNGTCVGAQCDGSRWIVSYAQNVAARNINTIPCPINVTVDTISGPDGTIYRFMGEQSQFCTYVNPYNRMSFPTGAGAAWAGLTYGSHAYGPAGATQDWPSIVSFSSNVVADYAKWLSNFTANITSGFKYFQIDIDPDGGYPIPAKKKAIAAWAAAHPAFIYIEHSFDTMTPAADYGPPL
jgi:hypothetical protein